MNKAIIAERILRVVTDRESAHTMAGDLIETYSGRRSLSFWMVLLQLFSAFVWKPTLGVIAAILVWSVVDQGLLVSFVRVFRTNPLSPMTLSHGIQLVKISANLSALGTFALVAYGIEDRLWMMSGAYAAMTGALVFSFWILDLRLILWSVLGVTIVISFSTQKMRRDLTIVAASFTSSLLIALLSELALHVIHPHGLGEALFVWIIPSTLGPAIVAAGTCGWIRPRAHARRITTG